MTNFVLFLDFDGPLYPAKVLNYADNQPPLSEQMLTQLEIHPFYSYWKADPACVNLLNDLHFQLNVKCVISSSWADDRMHTKAQIEGILKANLIHMELHPTWRTPRIEKNRFVQVSQWLGSETWDQYVVLDDTSSGHELMCPLDNFSVNVKLNPSNVVMVDEHNGLSREQVSRIKKYFMS